MAELDARDTPAGVEAARAVLLEIWTILGYYKDAMTLVGGSAPPLLTGAVAQDPYAGTLDVDVVVDPVSVPEETYRSIAERLRGRGYRQGDQPFRWFRDVTIGGQEVTVEVDLLAPVTARSGSGHRHERIEGVPMARRTEGAELVREATVERQVDGRLPDGRPNRVTLRVASVATMVVLKALAISERDRTKDAYDLDYLLAHAQGGIDAVAKEIRHLPQVAPIKKAIAILADKFDSVDSYGPASVASYRRLVSGSEESDRTRALAYARVNELLRLLE